MLAVRRHAKTAAAALIGVSLVPAGAVLMLRALWLWLLPQWGAVQTAAAMGLGLALTGALVLALAMRRPRRVPPPPVPQASPVTAVVAAFAQGYGAGQAIKRR